MEAPDNYYHQAGFCSQFPTEKHHSLDSNKSAADHFVVEDLLDFSNEDDAVVSDGIINNGSSSFDAVGNNSTDSSTVTVVDSCNSSSGGDIGCHKFHPESHFGSELCVPYDDLAELEWLSNFVEESFSSEDLQKMQLISGMKATRPDESSETGNFQLDQNGDDNCHNINTAIAGDGNNNNPIFHPEMLVPAKARSKRSRNAPCNWASRLLMLSPTTSSSEPEIVVGRSGSHPTSGKKTVKAIAMVQKKKDGGGGGSGSGGEGVAVAGNNVGDGRRCLHCATDKTPQWRTGPMGPKTLCNACGVRYKSGRLVPEYRPAASPTFVLTKHSNSHRKVMELRRQKEMMRSHEQHHPQQFLHHHQNIVFDVSNGDDYLIHQHVGPGFRQMI